MQKKNTSGGMGLLGTVQVVFIILKLCNLISWSWWTVLIPLWIVISIIILLIVAYAVIATAAEK